MLQSPENSPRQLPSLLWQSYYAPATLNEALALLDKNAGAARIIAGGTDLLIELERKVRRVQTLIDITRIAGLDEIKLSQDSMIHLGPLVTHNQVAASLLLVERAFPLAQACWEVGGPQIRNRGTLAGNIVTASPANDTITPLMALDAQVTLASAQSQRVLPLSQFFKGVRKTELQLNEVVTDIAFRALQPTERGCFLKLGLRRAQAISVANLCLILSFEGDIVQKARIALGSVAPTIVRAREAEDFLVKKNLDETVIAKTAELVTQAVKAIDDLRGSAQYRKDVIRNFVNKALRSLREKSERDNWPSRRPMLWGVKGPQPSPLAKIALHREGHDDLIECTVNGQAKKIRSANGKTLLDMLRDDLGLTGTKEGCAEGECGACTVLLDGMAVDACLVPAPRAHGAEILTIEGLSPSTAARLEDLHPVQRAFVEEGAVQCGYCTPGLILSSLALLIENKSPTREEIKFSLTGNLCRCTGYYKIIRAVERASERGA
jgi:carbon-monoxide dehydrogenase medium subunit